MSQKISEIETVNGVAIQKHLEIIYEELISETFGRREKQVRDQIREMATPCMACDSPVTYIIWSKKYSGYRGECVACNHNWPES
jgi:hypothetical protein